MHAYPPHAPCGMPCVVPVLVLPGAYMLGTHRCMHAWYSAVLGAEWCLLGADWCCARAYRMLTGACDPIRSGAVTNSRVQASTAFSVDGNTLRIQVGESCMDEACMSGCGEGVRACVREGVHVCVSD